MYVEETLCLGGMGGVAECLAAGNEAARVRLSSGEGGHDLPPSLS